MTVFTDGKQVRTYLRQSILTRFPSLAEYARFETAQQKRSFTSQRLSNILAGDKAIPEFMLRRWRIQKTVTEKWEVKV